MFANLARLTCLHERRNNSRNCSSGLARSLFCDSERTTPVPALHLPQRLRPLETSTRGASSPDALALTAETPPYGIPVTDAAELNAEDTCDMRARLSCSVSCEPRDVARDGAETQEQATGEMTRDPADGGNRDSMQQGQGGAGRGGIAPSTLPRYNHGQTRSRRAAQTAITTRYQTSLGRRTWVPTATPLPSTCSQPRPRRSRTLPGWCSAEWSDPAIGSARQPCSLDP